MLLGRLFDMLKHAPRGADVARRRRTFDGWIPGDAETGGVSARDHTETVKDYYDTLQSPHGLRLG